LAEDGVCIGSEWHSITYKKTESVTSNTNAWNWTFVKDFSLPSHS
jgi:hypothetical protein